MASFPDSYRVQTDAYAGPLDLLLYLVRRHEVDLNDIPIAQLTEQYMAHLKVIEIIDVEHAGEFLVMAATLLEIKSQMLMPRDADPQDPQTPEIAEQTVDPRFELVQQLLAYRRYKDAAIALEDRQIAWQNRHPIHVPRGQGEPDDEQAPLREIELEDADVMLLCETFGRLLESVGSRPSMHELKDDQTPIELHAQDIVDRLQRDGNLSLKTVFEGRHRGEMIGLFLALLELVRDRKVAVQQEGEQRDIALTLRPESEWMTAAQDTAPPWRNEQPGEVQYDWPDPAARKRAERRQRLRKLRQEREAAGQKAPAAREDGDTPMQEDDDEADWQEDENEDEDDWEEEDDDEEDDDDCDEDEEDDEDED